MNRRRRNSEATRGETVAIRGARYAIGASQSAYASIHILQGRIAKIATLPSPNSMSADCAEVDLSGFLIMPGLINAHDHLDFALFPRLADPPHRNYLDWGEQIHRKFPDIIAKHRAVPKEVRAWWGGLSNLLCGVTTVCHHNPLFPELLRDDFPVRVVRDFGWGHSLALGGDLRAARALVPRGRPFIVRACEGIDARARDELFALDRLGLLDVCTVIVHGLAMDYESVKLMRKRDASLIVCPSSNQFLFQKLPNLSLLSKIDRLALGSDSPLTAEGDLLDEIRFTMHHCNIAAQMAYRMVTSGPAAILRLKNGEGTIKESGVGDLIAVRDTGVAPGERLSELTAEDVELVMIGGRVQLASEAILDRLPSPTRHGLEPLLIGGVVRWLRGPVEKLRRTTEVALGRNRARLGNRTIGPSVLQAVEHAS